MAPTAEEVRRRLDYDPGTGAFRWKHSPCSNIPAGAAAGNTAANGYLRVGLNDQLFFAHRLAWLWMTGEWPPRGVDHRDGNRSNNAWTNLRLADQKQNTLNSRLSRANTSGFKGVSWHKAANRWEAHIKTEGRKKHLGLFEFPEQAHAAYMAAARSIEPDFARAK